MDAKFMAFVTRDEGSGVLPLIQLRPFKDEGTDQPVPSHRELIPHPELNDEHVADLGFCPHGWHVTFVSDRAVMGGKGQIMAFDITHIPWKPLVHSISPLIEGNEWPLCFEPNRSLVIEPSWTGTRDLGLRFLPFNPLGERYGACERLKLPLPTYTEGELSENHDGAVLTVASQPGDHPEPVCTWVEPDGKCHVVPLPRPPLTGKPGIEIAWWGPEGSRFTLYEDGLLFEMEHLNDLRLINVRPGSPDDMPKGGTPGRNRRNREWTLERPDTLAQKDKKSGAIVRRFHLSVPCEGRPMSISNSRYLILSTTEHEMIRVAPPAKGDG